MPKLLPAPPRDFPTGPNDSTVRMPWGYCGNEIWNGNRKAEVAVLIAERLAVFEILTGGACAAVPPAMFAATWCGF